MSVWDSVGSSYIEAATATLPLHRLVLFGCGLFGALAAKNQTHLSILETVAQLKLTDLVSLQSGPLASATFGDFLIGLGIVVVGWAGSRTLAYMTFSLAAKGTDLWRRAQDAGQLAETPQPPTDRQAAIEVIEASLKQPRTRLRALNAFAELFFGLAFSLLLATHWGNALDLVAGLGMLVLSLVFITVAVRLFLAEYFGPAMVMARLQGRPRPTPLNSG